MVKRNINIIGFFVIALICLFSIASGAMEKLSSFQSFDWTKQGTPQYGGTIKIRTASLPNNFDPSRWMGLANYWYETLFENDWLEKDRTVFQTLFSSENYWQGLIAESWEWKDARTLIIKIRKGVHWQDKPPVNGREFTAHDAQHHFDWLLGTGSGYTERMQIYDHFTRCWEKATALDDYTLEFKFKEPTFVLNYWSIIERQACNFEAPESVKQGLFEDWHNAVGTGPWMLTDYTAGTSMTLTKNPNYWGHDERYPQNRLPYADSVKILNIPDIATAQAAIRTGKIDVLTRLGWQQIDTLRKTIPDIQVAIIPWMSNTVEMKCDTKPFTDINVRKALQISIDRETIAKSHYGGLVDGKAAGIVSPALKGFCYTYDKWPQELKDEYGYNPEKARKMLAEAGYPNGFKTNIVASNNEDLELLEIIKAYFMDVGVDMEIRVMERNVWQDFVGSGKFDQLVYWTSSASHMPPQITMDMRYSKHPMNNARNNDPVYDSFVEKFKTASDSEEAKRLLVEADKRSLTQHWAVNVCPTARLDVVQPYLMGYGGEVGDRLEGTAFYWARLWLKQ